MAARMTYLERYLAGEEEQVRADLVALGGQAHEEPLHADALAVAHETIWGARANLETLLLRRHQLGHTRLLLSACVQVLERHGRWCKP